MSRRSNMTLFALRTVMACLCCLAFRAQAASLSSAVRGSDNQVDMFVEAALPKSCYEGETVEYIVTLYSTSPDVADVRIVGMPDFPDSFRSIEGIARNSRPSEIKVKGKTYYGWTILRLFVTPSQAGRFSVAGGSFLAYVGRERVVNDFFWGPRRMLDYEEFRVDGRKSEIKVSRLPEKGRPADFSGSVGEFSIEGWFPPGDITVGSDAIVVFTVSGFGSLEDMRLPDVNAIFSDGCRFREMSREEEVQQKDGRLFSEITLTCRFVPETEDGRISPLEVCVFNPRTGRYETIESFPLSWSGKTRKKTSSKPSEVYDI